MLFSIIMCTYNSAKTLKYAVDSVINQIYKDWELLILDNGSMDETTEILREYEKSDRRIICTFLQHNVGWAKGIQISLSNAKGKYMMFLGADDYLLHDRTLDEIQKEIINGWPDIIWTGYALAYFQEGVFHLVKTSIPEYQKYDKKEKLTELREIMQNVYYNSVMHYVKIEFLKKHGIDFYAPFYGDNQGMTEALCQAGTMVVMDRAEYVLTVNTSQTSSKTGWDYDISRQWESVKSAVPEIRNFRRTDSKRYIAERILRNLAGMLENIVLGGELRNSLMNRVHKSLSERFLKAEEWISSDAFGEMMYYAGRKDFTEQLIGAAGVLYWICKEREREAERIKKQSRWLSDFSEQIFIRKNTGEIGWKTYFSCDEAAAAVLALKNEKNKHFVGAELLLKDEIAFENMEIKQEIKNNLQDYMESMEI